MKEHAAYFDSLVALIPAKFYLPPTEEQEEGQQNVRETAKLCGGRSAFYVPAWGRTRGRGDELHACA